MKKTLLTLALAAASLVGAQAQLAISGYLANPAGTDSPYEYVQLIATQDLNFAVTPFSLVAANNGTATASGWIAGGGTTYKFNLTTGTVARGDVFYVGGSGQSINGAGSTSIASSNFIRSINTANTNGDGFGNSNSSGVFGNGGGNADGFGVFTGTTLTAASVPIDALFFGTAVGSAKPATGGYTVAANDRYAGGIFGDASGDNSFLFSDPGSGDFTRLTGTFDTTTNAWTTARVASLIELTSNSQLSAINSGITLTAVPEPHEYALLVGGLLVAVVFFRRRQASRA